MGEKRGCFKTGCFGCLGVLGIGVVFLVITAGVAWRGAGNKEVVDREIVAPAEMVVAEAGSVVEGQLAENLPANKGGKLVLDFSQGAFYVHPGKPGDELTIKANFDDDIYNLEDKFETLPDSTWVYQIRFYRTIGGMQALMRQIMGGGHENSIHVFIPPDMPIELVIETTEGGFEADLGGLWLTTADINFNKGGFELDFSDPLQRPLDSLMIRGAMGGFEASRIGNASPRVLGVNCSLGGAEIDLNGQWLNDCAARISVKMGGIAVIVPDDVNVEGAEVQGDGMRHSDQEVSLPTISLSVSASMGEIEVVR